MGIDSASQPSPHASLDVHDSGQFLLAAKGLVCGGLQAAASLQGGGLFVNPQSSSAPAKLRLLYECAPIAFIVEAAGGTSSNGAESVLKLKIDVLDRRTAITLGSRNEVGRSEHCL